MPLGHGSGEHAVEPEYRRPGGHPSRPEDDTLVPDETKSGTIARTAERDDRSMVLVEYALAIVAVAAAFLLAVIR